MDKETSNLVCMSPRLDGGPAGGEEDLFHQRRPGVPAALRRGGVHPQPVFLFPPPCAPPGGHQGQRVSVPRVQMSTDLPLRSRSWLGMVGAEPSWTPVGGAPRAGT